MEDAGHSRGENETVAGRRQSAVWGRRVPSVGACSLKGEVNRNHGLPK
jgi:hypothetical protein